MPRARYKRKCAVAATSRARKRNRANPPTAEEVRETNNNKTQQQELEKKDEAKLTAEEARAVCEALIKQTFSAVGMDVDSYRACFRSCVEKAISTGMVYATSWAHWGGYKDFNFKMMCVAVLCQTTGKLHCPTAPTLVVAYTLLRIRKVVIQETALAYLLMNICKTLDLGCAKAAIHHYEDNPDVILMFQDTFEQPSSWPPMSRNKVEEQGQFAKVAVLGYVHPEKPYHGQRSSKAKGPKSSGTAPERLQTTLNTPEISLLKHLTLPRLKVLSVRDKDLALLWVKNTKPETFAKWIKETKEDIKQYQWVETVKRKLPQMRAGDLAGTVFKRMEERAMEDPNPSSLEDLAVLKEIFKNRERCGIDPSFYEKMNQWMLRMEHKADEQTATSAKVLEAMEKLEKLDLVLKKLEKLDLVDEQVAEQAATSSKVLKRLDLVLAKPNETSEPMRGDAEPCRLGDSLVDFADAKSPLLIDEELEVTGIQRVDRRRYRDTTLREGPE
nr:hypothetical protein [Trichoderma atroviride]